jgi:hypothetical protein
VPISFPSIETISPYLFGREDFDLRQSDIREKVRDLTLTNVSFFFRTILDLNFYQPFHNQWFDFELDNPRTLLLGPRGSLKCVHPLTLVASENGAKYITELKHGDEITSIFHGIKSSINVVGRKVVSSFYKIHVGLPYDFWIYTSPEHKFFCFDLIRRTFEVVQASRINPSIHLVLLSRPHTFKPIGYIKPRDIPQIIQTVSQCRSAPFEVVHADLESFRLFLDELAKEYTNDQLRLELPWVYNTIQVLKFYHGIIKCDDQTVRQIIKRVLLSKQVDLNRDEIAFLVDDGTNFKPIPLQVNEDFACFAMIESIKSTTLRTQPFDFYDCDVTNSHYIANGFVTHNSTVTTVGHVLRSALMNPDRRFAIISSTGKLASGYVKKIKRICESNPVIRYCFNDIIDPRKVTVWSNEALEFARRSIFPEPTVWALGEGTDFTGFHFEEAHFDDMVTVRHKKSATLRKHTWDWFRLTAMPAIERKGGRAHVKGTRYHWDDMYGKLIEIFETTQGWKMLRTPACDEDLLSKGVYKSFWPDQYPEDELKQIRTEYGEDVFWLQYMCSAGVVMTSEKMNYIDKIKEKFLPASEIDRCSDIVLGVDLAGRGSGAFAQSERKSSFSITALGRHEQTGKWVVLESIKIKRPTLNDQREWLQTMYLRYNPLVAAIERNAYQSVFLEYLEEGNVPLSVKPIKSFEEKDARFEYLINMILSGSLYFIEDTCQPLLEEIFTYPENTSDCIDSTFFALRVGFREPRIRFIMDGEEED